MVASALAESALPPQFRVGALKHTRPARQCSQGSSIYAGFTTGAERTRRTHELTARDEDPEWCDAEREQS